MKESQFKEIVKREADEYAQGIDVWNRIRAEADERATEAKARRTKRRRAAIFASLGGLLGTAAVVVSAFLIVYFVTRGAVREPARYDVSAGFRAVREAETLRFRTEIDVEYGGETMTKTVDGSIGNKEAACMVAQSFGGKTAESELYTDGRKVYQIDKALELKFISDLEADQVYDYAFILSHFEPEWFLDETIEKEGENIRVTNGIEPDKIGQLTGSVVELDKMLEHGAVKRAAVAFLIDKDENLLSLTLTLELNLDGINARAVFTADFLGVDEPVDIQPPSDLDDYARPVRDLTAVNTAFENAWAGLAARKGIRAAASQEWLENGQAHQRNEWTMERDGAGAIHVKRTAALGWKEDFDAWVHNGIEYRNEYGSWGTLKRQSLMTRTETEYLRRTLPEVYPTTYAAGEMCTYDGRTYIKLSAQNFDLGFTWSPLASDTCLTAVLDQNGGLKSLEFWNDTEISGIVAGYVLSYEIEPFAGPVALPDPNEYIDTLTAAYEEYAAGMNRMRESGIAFDVTIEVNDRRYTALVQIDWDSQTGIIQYPLDNAFFAYKDFGYPIDQYYSDGVLHTTDIKNTLDEPCGFDEFLNRVRDITSAFGLSPFDLYRQEDFWNAETTMPGTFDGGILYMNDGLGEEGVYYPRLSYGSGKNGTPFTFSVAVGKGGVWMIASIDNIRPYPDYF